MRIPRQCPTAAEAGHGLLVLELGAQLPEGGAAGGLLLRDGDGNSDRHWEAGLR